MVSNKNDFIKTFLPDNIEDISFAQIDLDISDLAIADILRNINKAFPKNSRNRNSIASGNMAVSVLCKSELMYPISGLLLIVASSDIDIELISKNYIIISISEDKITNDDDIKIILDNITKYLVANFKDILKNFNDFYIKFVYDMYENEVNGYDI